MGNICTDSSYYKGRIFASYYSKPWVQECKH